MPRCNTRQNGTRGTMIGLVAIQPSVFHIFKIGAEFSSPSSLARQQYLTKESIKRSEIRLMTYDR